MVDGNFFHTVTGSGPPIVIIHGLLGSSKNWAQQAKMLANSYQVFCIDLPNHGQSYRTAQFNYQQIAETFNSWLKQQFTGKVHLIGHSMGGKVVMKAMDLEPTLFNKCVVVDIAPVKYPLHHLDIFDALNAINLKQIQSRKEADVILQNKISTPSIRNFLLHSLLFKNDEWSWEFDLNHLSSNQHSVAESPFLTNPITNPTLFIKSEDSDYIQTSNLAHIKQHFSHASFKQIANSGHWPHAEKAKVFNHMVVKFLNN